MKIRNENTNENMKKYEKYENTVPVRFLAYHDEVDSRFVMCPRAKFHRAILRVERKIGDVNRAGGFEDGRRHPRHLAFIAQTHLAT